MKKLITIITFLSLSTVFAEVKPAGTVLTERCGSTHTFPVDTSVCTANVVGSEAKFLILNSTGELQPVDPANEIYVPVNYEVLHLEVFPGITKEIYTGYYVQKSELSPYAIVVKVQLIISTVEGEFKSKGTLKINDQVIFGGDSIEMETMFHTA